MYLKNATRGDLVLWKRLERATFSVKNVISGPLGGALLRLSSNALQLK